MSGKSTGILYVVATPIGNLDDLTQRARQTLAAVSLVAAEDTRHTGRLLFSIGCKTQLMALHDHNEEKVFGKLIEMLLNGDSVALVSDAGTPLVSDPGFRLVRAAHENGIAVTPIPGASALTAAISAAGLATDRFCFEGFAASKRAARKEYFERLRDEPRTMIFYESVHRIDACLADMCGVFGADRAAFIGREMTKLHEQCVQATLGDLQRMLGDGTIVKKGEFVIVLAGASAAVTPNFDVDRLLLELADKLSARDAARLAATVSGGKKNELYERLLQLKSTDNC